MEKIENLKKVKEIAEMFKVNEMTIYRAIKANKIPYKMVGRRKYYNPLDFIIDGE